MTRRISRTPALLGTREQEAFVRALERYPDLQKNVEILTGRPISEMSFQEKVAACSDYAEMGAGAAALAAAGRAVNEVNRLAGAVLDEEATAEKLRRAEQREAELAEENAQLRNRLGDSA